MGVESFYGNLTGLGKQRDAENLLEVRNMDKIDEAEIQEK